VGSLKLTKVLVHHSFRGSQGQASVLIHLLTLAASFQSYISPWSGRLLSYCSDEHHVGPPSWWSPDSLFLGLFLERLIIKMRDHLVAEEFKNPGESALHTNKLWVVRRAQPMDSPQMDLTFWSPCNHHKAKRYSVPILPVVSYLFTAKYQAQDHNSL